MVGLNIIISGILWLCCFLLAEMAEGPIARLRELENIEKDIATAISNAGKYD